MARRSDWRAALVAYLSATRDKAFAYGVHDCTLFAADAVQAMTGVDLAADWRGKYSTLAEGEDLLRAAGYDGNTAMVSALFAECPVAMAQPGDIAVIATEIGDSLGIVQGEAIYVVSPRGLSLAPLLTAYRAFKVS